MSSVLAALDGREEGSAGDEGRVVLRAAAMRAGVLRRNLSAAQIIAALFPETALDRIRTLSGQAIRRHAELMIRVMAEEFRHPDHDPRSDACPFRIGFALKYEDAEVHAFEARTHDAALNSIDLGGGESDPQRADWYLMQGTRRSIRRAYEPHRDGPWARVELDRPVRRAHAVLPRRVFEVMQWIDDSAVRSFVRRHAQRVVRGARAPGDLTVVSASGTARVASTTREPILSKPRTTQPDEQTEVSLPSGVEIVPSDALSDELHRAQRRLANKEATLGFSHPDVASELHLIGAIHHEASRFSAAVASYGMALVIRERALGSDHPDVASTLEDLAAARRDDGEPEEADRLLARAHEIRRRRASAETPHA